MAQHAILRFEKHKGNPARPLEAHHERQKEQLSLIHIFIRERDGKGRHTTTHRQLLMLPSGAMVIDTPGMRELGMWDLSQGLDGAFADVEQHLGHCKFRDCKHQSEPGCAVKEAIARGTLSLERWNSYNALKKERKYTESKTDYLREKQQWHKNLAKQNRLRENKQKEYGGKN